VSVDLTKRKANLDKVAKELGSARVISFDDRPRPAARLSFRSPMLDWATFGGARMGQITRLWGPPKGGKSLATYGLIWSAQNFHEVTVARYEPLIHWLEQHGMKDLAKDKALDLAYLLKRYPERMYTTVYDTEKRFSEILARQLGIKLKGWVDIVDSNIVEEVAASITEGLESTHLHIIDSLGDAQSLEEAGTPIGKQTQRQSAKAWTVRLKQVRSSKWVRDESTLILVDQIRAGSGDNVFSAPKDKPSDIRNIHHKISVDIQFGTPRQLWLNARGDLTDDWDTAKEAKRSVLGTNSLEPHGFELYAHVDKNLDARSGRNARMRFRLPVADPFTGEVTQRVGYDREFELLESAQYFGMIRHAPKDSHYYEYDEQGEKIQKQHWHGATKARMGIRNDPELAQRIELRMVRDQ
jgi:hypothetical protein